MRRRIAAIAAGLCLAAAAPAIAGEDAEGYNPVPGVPAGAVAGQAQAPAPVAGNTSGLPFTGTDLGMVALGGALLIGLGFGIRRSTSAD